MTGFKRYIKSVPETIDKLFDNRKILTACEWAEKIRRMDGGKKYRFDFAPYQKEMMQTPFEPNIQMTVFQLASRLGKTETVMNIIGHAIDESPRRILTLYPTTSQAEKWSKETLEKELFESTPKLNWLVRGGRRDSSNTILHKLFPGGLINIFGGNAPGEMRRAKGNLLFADEVDALMSQSGDEGDQLQIFWMRGSEYSDTIRIAASYPSVEGQSRIAQLMETSDYRKWYTPCLKCGEPFVMLREHIKFPENKPEEAKIKCPNCGELLNDNDRKKIIKKGFWKATKDFTGVAGFWGNGMISPHPVQKGFKSHLHWIAAQEQNIEISDNPDRARHVFVNTFDAECYKPERVEAPEVTELESRREDYNPRIKLPEGVLIITAGVDVQKRYLEISVWGWGENKESWLLEHHLIHGAPDDPGTWQSLEDYLAGCVFPHPYGTDLGLFRPGSKVMVDAGHWDQHVLPWTFKKQNLGVFAIQGSPTINAPILGKPRVASSPKARIYPLGVNQCKDIIYTRLTLSKPDSKNYPPGYIHLNRSATSIYLDGLTCEYGKEEKFRGEIYVRYVCPNNKRNEPLDTLVYAMAGRILINPRFDRIKENLLSKKTEEKIMPKRNPTFRKRKNFAGKFSK
jgi:phage terminase large subunit GpA-like protein